MFKKLFFIIICASFVFAPSTMAQNYSEVITSFDVDIRVSEDNKAVVTESILYDFGANERRGIIREIPIVYTLAEGDVSLDLTVIGVTDELGNPQPFVEEGYYYKSIRIGDPDIYITGAHWYVITYIVENIVNGFDSHDELYWNVTGNEWDVPINSASIDIYLPDESVTEEMRGYFNLQACLLAPVLQT